MKNRSKFAKFVWPSLLFTALLALVIWFQHRPDPNWYISPPLDAQGHRVQGPIPYGWKLDPHDSHMMQGSHLPTGILKPGERVTLIFVSQEPMWSRWLRWVRKQPAPEPSHLYIDVGWKPEDLGYSPKNPADGTETVERIFGVGPYLSYRMIKAGKPPLFVSIAFDSDDKPTFDRNHASINRFRIE